MGLGKKDGEAAKLVSDGKDVEAGKASDGGAPSSSEPKKKTCGEKCVTFWRCALGFILFPFVFVLTFLAVLVWIILLPRKCFSFRVKWTTCVFCCARSSYFKAVKLNATWTPEPFSVYFTQPVATTKGEGGKHREGEREREKSYKRNARPKTNWPAPEISQLHPHQSMQKYRREKKKKKKKKKVADVITIRRPKSH